MFAKRVYEHIRSIEPSVRFSEVKFKEFSERVSKQLIEDAEKQKHKLETLVRTVEDYGKGYEELKQELEKERQKVLSIQKLKT